MISTADKVRVLVFLMVVVSVFGATAWELGRILLERFKVVQKPTPWLRRAWRVGILSAGSLGVACVAWGFLVEPYWPEVTHHRVPIRGIPEASKPIRLVHVTDLHCDPKVRLEDRLPDLVSAQNPDLIVFTGDCINHPDGLPHFKRTLTGLSAIAPTYVVQGNWDTAYWHDLDLFGETGAKEFDGNGELLSLGEGSRLWFAGVAYGREQGVTSALRGRPDDAGVVFLYHTPDLAEELADLDVDLILAGHTHGGQVALPGYGALITLSRFGKRFEGGLYRVTNRTWMNVSRGIGMEGGLAPRVRFAARPEISVLDLVPVNDRER
ncbi:MAG: metallophosphoesterase [Planctomycetota bacterium]|jgi:predicted MPP superfamily phosphohydrolase